MTKMANPAPYYENVIQNNRSNERGSVYGEMYYLATGVSFKGPWNPSPLKGISSYPPDIDITLEEFFNDYRKILPWISDTPVDKRNPEHVKFLLHSVFPDLETKIARTGRTEDILDIISRLSCVKQCPVVTRYALHMILEALTKTSYDSGGMFNDFLLKCESFLRDSLLDNSLFDHENAEDQGLRIFVYSRCLMILYANIVQGTIPLANIDKNAELLLVRLGDLEEQIFFAEKDKPRYAICCIKETIARFSSIKKKDEEQKNCIHMFLIWLKKYNSKGEENKGQRNDSVKNFLSKLKTSKTGWYDFHAAVFCLGSQIHKKPKNKEILRSLVENYVIQHADCCSKWTSEGEWQTGLVLGNVLEDILNYNHDRSTRALFCLCLIHCFKHLTKRNSLEKLMVQQSLQRSLYGPNRDQRQVILDHLELGERKRRKKGVTMENMHEHIAITHSMDYLVQKYKKQLLPSSQDFKMKNNLKGYFSVSFRGEKALVKIIEATKDDLVREARKGPSKIHQQLVIEAYTLRRLNSKPHPNILRVFACDTLAQPYHLITELVSEGSLLQFLHSLRYRPEPMPVPSALIEMMFGIMDAVIYLNEQHLVHLAVMAANFLVSHDNVCKLTGFHYAREMIKQQSGNYEYVSIHDKTAIRHAAPECLENGLFSENSVSWAVGIMLFEMHTYGVSPYNQYSNDQANQIRSHVTSRGKLRMEECIPRDVCELIEMCLIYEKEDRPSLVQLRMELERIHQQIIEEERDWPAAIYPDLTNVDLSQNKNAINSIAALEDLDEEENMGFFGSATTSIDRPTIRNYDMDKVIRELVLKTQKEDLEKLKYLKHENIVSVISLSNHDNKNVALVTEYSGLGNLLQKVLVEKYLPEQLVTFVAQISQGVQFLHDNNIIHGDLRAEHIMVFPNDKVKVSRLGRSKAVGMMIDTKCPMPEDAVRWSPPEVIKDGIYSHSSDVYSFGLVCYELFDALDAAKECKTDDVKPFPTIEDNQILAHLQANKRPARPQLMPIWVYLVAKQCLLHLPSQRPPFVLIEDALTSCKPFESCLLSHWVKRHENEADNIDVNVTQSKKASHVIKKPHKTFGELLQLAPVEVFLDHTYVYARGNKDFGEKEGGPSFVDESKESAYEEIDPLALNSEEFCKQQSQVYMCPRALPPIPGSSSESDKDSSTQESADTLGRAKSEIALFTPSSPPFNIKAYRLSFTEHGTSYRFDDNVEHETSDHPYDIVEQNNSCRRLPDHETSDQPYQNVEQDKSCLILPDHETSDQPYYENVEKHNEAEQMMEDEGAVEGEPVECSLQLALPQRRPDDQEHMSMVSNGRGATECSWPYSLRSQNGQQDGSSSNEAPTTKTY